MQKLARHVALSRIVQSLGLATLIIVGPDSALSQALTATPGKVIGHGYGEVIVLSPDPNDPDPVTPTEHGMSGIPTRFVLHGIQGSNYQITFDLPSEFDICSDLAGCAFDTNAVYVNGTGERRNPNVPFTIYLQDVDSIVFYLGITIHTNEEYQTGAGTASVSCTAVNLSNQDTMRATTFFGVAIDWGLPVFASEGEMSGLVPETMYTSVPAPSGDLAISPRVSGNERGIFAEYSWPIIHETTFVSVALPSFFMGETNYLERAPCFPSTQSIYFVEEGRYLTPHGVDTIVRSPGRCSITLRVGLSLVIPESLRDVSFWGSVVFSAEVPPSIWGGGWQSAPTIITATVDRQPVEYRLLNNFPNPFNSETNIEYVLAEESSVTLKVFNLLGEEVRTLVEDTQGKGYQRARFNATGLATGMYLYRISASSIRNPSRQFLQIGKMLYLK